MRSFITYSSPNIIRMVKLRKMKWTGHVARMGRRIQVVKPEKKGRHRHK
jgi:hypothetical protein